MTNGSIAIFARPEEKRCLRSAYLQNLSLIYINSRRPTGHIFIYGALSGSADYLN
jgi:hypothetical protein